MQDVGIRARLQGAGSFVADAGRVNSALDRMGNTAVNTAHKAQAVDSMFSGLVGSVAKVGFALIGLQMTLNVFSQLGQAAFGANLQWEQLGLTFQTLLHSASAGMAKLQELSEFARKTPFTLPDVVQGAKNLLAYGFAAESIIPILRDVGDAAAALGKESLPSIIRALGQMQARTKVSAQEMLQLTEAGIPAWQILADAIGVSVGNLQKMVEDGVVPANQAIQVLLAGMRERFGGLMEAQSQTLGGMLSNFSDWAFRARTILMEPLFENLKLQAADLLKTLDQPSTYETLRQLGLAAASGFDAIGDALRVVIPQAVAFLTWLGTSGVPTARGAVMQFAKAWDLMGVQGQQNILIVAGLLLARGPLVGAIGTAISAVKLLNKSFLTIPITLAALGVAAWKLGDVMGQGLVWGISKAISQIITWINELGIRMASTRLPFFADWGKQLANFGRDLKLEREQVATRMGDLISGAFSLDTWVAEAGKVGGLLDTAFDAVIGRVETLAEPVMGDLIARAREWATQMEHAGISAASFGDPDRMERAAHATGNMAEEAGNAKKSIGELAQELRNAIEAADRTGERGKAAAEKFKDAFADLKDITRESITAAQDVVQELTASVNELEDAIRAAQNRMRGFADVRLPGMQAAEDELFDLDMSIKKARLEELKMGAAGKKAADDVKDSAKQMGEGFDMLAAQQRELTEGIPVPFTKWEWELEQARRKAEQEAAAAERPRKESAKDAEETLVEQLRRMRDIKELEKDIKFEPQQRALKETFETLTGANIETPFDQALAGLIASAAQVDVLNGRLAEQKGVLGEAKAELEKQQDALAELNRLTGEQERAWNAVHDVRLTTADTEDLLLGKYQVQASTQQQQNTILQEQKGIYDELGAKAAELQARWDGVAKRSQEVAAAANLSSPTLVEGGRTGGFGGHLVEGGQHGGSVETGGLIRVGEAGPEVVYLPKGSTIFPHNAVKWPPFEPQVAKLSKLNFAEALPGAQQGGRVERAGMLRVGEAGSEVLSMPSTTIAFPAGTRMLPAGTAGPTVNNRTFNDQWNIQAAQNPVDTWQVVQRELRFARIRQGR